MRSFRLYIHTMFLLLGICASIRMMGQTVQLPEGQNWMRNNQLTDGGDSLASLCINPIMAPLSMLDSLAPLPAQHTKLKIDKKGQWTLLPLSLVQQYNSHHSYDWNNAPMIPAKGYQMVASAGIFGQLGKHISIQINPQFVFAGNPAYETTPYNFVPREWASYYVWLNNSDIPLQFGNKNYAKLLPGQSSIRYNTRQWSFGISTENMWWGPGYYNSLIMSNNAPGFLHATINTLKPVHTPIGSFEGQFIGGKLDGSNVLPEGIYNTYDGTFLYQPKKDEWRYMTGLVITWQPKWIKHLFLGISKASYLYHSDIHSPLDILPLQGFFGTRLTRSEKDGLKSSLGSLFFRYLLPSQQAEFYMEYGRADRSLMPWGVFQDPQYRRGYVTGLKKLFDSKNNSHIQLLVELAQLQVPTGELTNDPHSWYTSVGPRQGYTQMGRVIGAGIGPGSNSQTLEISWVKGYKKLGIQLDRVVRNNDFYYYAFQYIPTWTLHWVDLATTFKADWDYKQFLLSARLGIARSNNYLWQLLHYEGDTFKTGYNVLNVNAKISVSYRF